MKHYLIAAIIAILVLGLYFDTSVTKDFISEVLIRMSDILASLSGK
jgi:hypothetical protein|tara:strand:- start:265 stop:402 length:138 start_codon:yes stop_codon:yes gene_type:complete